MIQLKSKRKKFKFRQTVRKQQLILGLVVSIILISSPFLFYLYKYAPGDTDVWQTKFITITSGGFDSVQVFVHQLFTKITFFIITSIWFLTCKYWWKYTILIPLTMFLFQLSGVINFSVLYIDEYEFIDSLPFIVPLIALHIFVSNKISYLTKAVDLKDEVEFELSKL